MCGQRDAYHLLLMLRTGCEKPHALCVCAVVYQGFKMALADFVSSDLKIIPSCHK